jgi:hypothetical protein
MTIISIFSILFTTAIGSVGAYYGYRTYFIPRDLV